MLIIRATRISFFIIFLIVPAAVIAVPKVTENSNKAESIIASIEKLPRSERLTSYVKALRQKSLEPETRNMLIAEFAKHVLFVSPLYGKSRVLTGRQMWISLLTEGWKTESMNPNIVKSLTRIFINRERYTQALEVIAPFHNENPKDHEATAWHSLAVKKTSSSGSTDEEKIPEVDIHFCVITRNPKVHSKATLEQLHKEVAILNRYFHTLRGKAIVKFRFKSASFYNEVKGLSCKLVSLGDSQEPYDTEGYAQVFNQCNHAKVRDPYAINFYVYDSFSPTVGYKDQTCHGKRNSNRPYVLIDFERLNHRDQSPEEHEMGHAFGLDHVGVPGAAKNDSTNIMTSAGLGFGSGGRRNRGFTESQTAVILYHAERTLAPLKGD